MGKFYIETNLLVITEADESMVEAVHKNSLDEDNRRFVPDEVFETLEEAQLIIQSFLEWYKKDRAPLVYPIILKEKTNIGYVQAVPFGNCEWEIGYHIAQKYTGNGYATEAVKSFLPIVMEKLKIKKIIGVCLQENVASTTVMEKCGFILEYKGFGNYQGESRNISMYSYHA